MYTCSAKYYVDTKRKRKLCKMLRKHKIVQPKYWLSLIRWQWSTCTICLNLNSCSASAVMKTMTTIWNIRTDSFTGCCTIFCVKHFALSLYFECVYCKIFAFYQPGTHTNADTHECLFYWITRKFVAKLL